MYLYIERKKKEDVGRKRNYLTECTRGISGHLGATSPRLRLYPFLARRFKIKFYPLRASVFLYLYICIIYTYRFLISPAFINTNGTSISLCHLILITKRLVSMFPKLKNLLLSFFLEPIILISVLLLLYVSPLYIYFHYFYSVFNLLHCHNLLTYGRAWIQQRYPLCLLIRFLQRWHFVSFVLTIRFLSYFFFLRDVIFEELTFNHFLFFCRSQKEENVSLIRLAPL